MPLPPKKALKDLKLLLASGYAIPENLLIYVDSEVDKKDGIKQVWICKGKGCSESYKSMVRITAISCPQGHSMKLLREY